MSPTKIPVSLLFSPATAPVWFPPASRLLNASLRASLGLEVITSSLPIEIFVESYRAQARAARAAGRGTTLAQQMQLPMLSAPHLDVVAGRYDRQILDAVPTETVLLSALSVYDLPVAVMLLREKKRVVLGGSLASIYSPADLRQVLGELGVEGRALRSHLNIVSGLVDPDTDLSPVVSGRQDVTLPSPRPHAWLRAGPDTFAQHNAVIQTVLGRTPLALPLSTGCWYGECRFCAIKRQPSIDLTAGLPVELLAEQVALLAAAYGTESVVLTDNYLRLTDTVRAFLKQRRPLKVTAYSGIRLLTDPDYARDLSQHLDGLRIGLESLSDFTLEQVGKGVTAAEVAVAVDNLIRFFDREVTLTFLIVHDLPYRDAEDLRASFVALEALKQRLLAAGFSDVSIAGFPLIPFFGTELLDHSPLLEILPVAELADEELCGIWTTHRWYERTSGAQLPAFLERLLPAYRRRDVHGAILPGDFTLLDPTTLAFLQHRPKRPGEPGGARLDHP